MNVDYKHAKEMAKKAREDFEEKLAIYVKESGTLGKYLRLVPQKQQKLFYSLYNGSKSYSKAVKAKCLDCTCFNISQIRDCKVETCPLYKLRPYSNKE